MSFKGADGLVWPTEIDGFSYVRMKRELGVDVMQLFAKEDGLPDLLQDLEKLIDALWILAEETAVERGYDEVAFAKVLKGDSLGDAIKSFEDALINFLATPEQREAARAVFKGATKVGQEMLTRIEKSFQRLNNSPIGSGNTPESSGRGKKKRSARSKPSRSKRKK